jgi:hypothetical protein
MNNAIEAYENIPAVANAHSILTQKFSDVIADVVVGYEATKLSGVDNWNRQVQFAVDSGCYDKDSFNAACLPGELEVLEYRHLQGENVKTKGGKWKMSKVCSNSSYSSNKAVIGGALDAGVYLTDDDGNVKPKSALEKEIKEAKDEKSPEEKVGTAWATFNNLFGKCNAETQEAYAKLMRELANEILNDRAAA